MWFSGTIKEGPFFIASGSHKSAEKSFFSEKKDMTELSVWSYCSSVHIVHVSPLIFFHGGTSLALA